MQPFITFITPTYKRPLKLAACLASVGGQTIADQIEHLVLPDYIGVGIGGMYQRLPDYAKAVHGRYVHLLADDDVLSSPHAVESVQAFAEANNYPAMIIVSVVKQDVSSYQRLPAHQSGPPIEGRIDLGCLIARRDVWLAHVGDYGNRYEGDFDFANAVYQAGFPFTYAENILFLQGAVMRGRPE